MYFYTLSPLCLKSGGANSSYTCRTVNCTYFSIFFRFSPRIFLYFSILFRTFPHRFLYFAVFFYIFPLFSYFSIVSSKRDHMSDCDIPVTDMCLVNPLTHRMVVVSTQTGHYYNGDTGHFHLDTRQTLLSLATLQVTMATGSLLHCVANRPPVLHHSLCLGYFP